MRDCTKKCMGFPEAGAFSTAGFFSAGVEGAAVLVSGEGAAVFVSGEEAAVLVSGEGAVGSVGVVTEGFVAADGSGSVSALTGLDGAAAMPGSMGMEAAEEACCSGLFEVTDPDFLGLLFRRKTDWGL